MSDAETSHPVDEAEDEERPGLPFRYWVPIAEVLSRQQERIRELEDLLIQAEGNAQKAERRATELEFSPCLDSLNDLQERVKDWVTYKFPDTTVCRTMKHLQDEAEELRASIEDWMGMQEPVKDNVIWPTVVQEWCDTALLMLSLANLGKFSLFDCLNQRLQQVSTREYAEDGERGYSHHVEEEPQP
jgi:hypothetical protein